MKTKQLIQIILIVFFAAAFIFLRVLDFVREPATNIVLGDHQLEVLLASTDKERYKGLSDRESLGKYDGMLFLFDDKRRHGMVMRDMEFGLDIIWLNEEGIIDIARNLQPMSGLPDSELPIYYPRTDSIAVIELEAGMADLLELEIGDQLRILE